MASILLYRILYDRGIKMHRTNEANLSSITDNLENQGELWAMGEPINRIRL